MTGSSFITPVTPGKVICLIVLSLYCAYLVGCSSVSGGNSPGGEGNGEGAIPGEVAGDDLQVEDESVDSSIGCPAETVTLPLQVDHLFTTDTGGGDWVWTANGLLSLTIEENGSVSNNPGETLGGQQSGEFTLEGISCSFTAPAMISATINGTCDSGVVTMRIIENWQMSAYNWQCPEDDPFSYNIPATPPTIHEEVSLILTASGSTQARLPWGGGDGYKTWQIIQDLPLVPLVP